MQPDEFTWIDSVPLRPARRKRIVISEAEWMREGPVADKPAVRAARFWINSTELLAILVEETTAAHDSGSTEQTIDPPQPRVRVGGRSYLLSVRPPSQDATA